MTITENRNALPPGYRLHWYEIISVLGQGGFGITYLARDPNLGVEVAIKEYLPTEFAVREADLTLHPVSAEKAKQFQLGLDRFLSEARTLAQFRHPNLVRVSSVFTENNTAYMVMDYERGGELKALIDERKTLSEQELLNIVLPLLDALKVVHEAGFIHRDIKPSNILVRADGSPVLIDFGSARQALGVETQTLTSVVSAGYAPYEQYANDGKQQGAWTDIYGLGATLYRAISGQEPINALDRGTKLLVNEGDPLKPGREVAVGDYSDHFLAAIDHALGFNRIQRPRTLAQWQRELSRSGPELATGIPLDNSEEDVDEAVTELFSTGLPAITPSARGPSVAEVAPITVAPQQVVTAIAPTRRWLLPLLLPILVVILLAGYMVWQSPAAEPVTTGHFKVATNESAEVFLDGNLVGLASPRLPWGAEGIEQGEHQLELRAEGFLPLQVIAMIIAGEWTNLNLQLEPKPAVVDTSVIAGSDSQLIKVTPVQSFGDYQPPPAHELRDSDGFVAPLRRPPPNRGGQRR